VETRTGDGDVEHGKQTMRDQLDHMDGLAGRVKLLRNEIPEAFSAEAVRRYQERLDDWQTAYKLVKDSFNDALSGFGQAHNLIDHHHQQAVHLADSSFTGNNVYHGLLR
jgi:hypothetical protein